MRAPCRPASPLTSASVPDDDDANGVGAPGGNPVGQIAREPGALAGFCAHGATALKPPAQGHTGLQSRQTKDDVRVIDVRTD